MRASHHAGPFQVQGRHVRLLAESNPLTLCWRCQLRLDQHQPHHNGKPARWTAGHTQPGSTTWQPWLQPMITVADCERAARGDFIAPEVSRCNYGARDEPPPPALITTRAW